MPTITEYGYLELPYMVWPYLTGVVTHAVLSQSTMVINSDHEVRSEINQQIVDSLHDVQAEVDQKIADFLHTVLSETERRIDSDHDVRSEIDRKIADFLHDVQSQVDLLIGSTHAIQSEAERRIDAAHTVNAQTLRQIANALHDVQAEVDRLIVDFPHTARSEIDRRIDAIHLVRSQVDFQIGLLHDVQSEIDRKILDYPKTKGMEVRRGTVVHEHCEDGGYLLLPYLTTPYLADLICARVRSEIERHILDYLHPVREQVDQEITSSHTIREEVERRIDATHVVRSQVQRLAARLVRMQITQVLYNTTQLRILCDFPSRGATSGAGNNAWGYPVAGGQNWEASSTLPGDFHVFNVNTDIVEQMWRSNTGDITGVTLKCDTEVSQGVFIDTFAILNHNLTTSANVVLEGATDSAFASIGFAETLTIIADHPNIYYIAPTLPTQGFRYWRITISDPTNTETSLQIGTILFGSSIIFQGECFTQRVRKTTKHFADRVRTEGFTNVSNDRALKFSVGLEFLNLDFSRGNYRNLRAVLDHQRTSLKCLWIPTPQFPQRFAVFGKLPEIPVEEHNVIAETADYVNLNVEIDESL